jgi:FKBP-type peptidyl-prolyl cis-trans isomerase (trigger factor)
VVEAERIEPSDEQVSEMLESTAQRTGSSSDELLRQLRKVDRLERVRDEVANRQALELLVREAKPISVEQAKARDKLWTPDKQAGEPGAGQLWTPGS